MYDTPLTIVGNVVSAPRYRRTNSGHDVVNFRVASTPRRFDRETGSYVDNNTLYISVTCWRSLARNVANSREKGQPVIVTGRLTFQEYTKDEQLRVSYDLEATAVGHDLTRGTSVYTKVRAAAPLTAVAVDEDGVPEDNSDYYRDVVRDEVRDDDGGDGDVPCDVDPVTGEVREPALVSG